MKRAGDETDAELEGKELPMRLLISNKEVGTIIGKGGANIKGIREQASCKLHVADLVPGSADRLVTATGTVAAVSKAVELILNVLETDPGKGEEGGEPKAEPGLKIVLSNNQAGRIIGKGGAGIKSLREESQASIRIESTDANGGDERVVTMGGAKEAIINAYTMIAQQVVAMPPDDGRSQPKRQMLGMAAGPPPGFPVAYAPQGYGAQPYGQPVRGFAPAGYQYGQQAAQVAYGQPGMAAYPGQPVGFSGQQQAYGLVHAPPGVVGGEMKQEQLVNQDQAGRLIGRGGQGVKELRDISRAHIRIESECEPGTESRKVTVSGGAAEVQMAIALINQKLAEMNRPA